VQGKDFILDILYLLLLCNLSLCCSSWIRPVTIGSCWINTKAESNTSILWALCSWRATVSNTALNSGLGMSYKQSNHILIQFIARCLAEKAFKMQRARLKQRTLSYDGQG
jgi:hypothetical protein